MSISREHGEVVFLEKYDRFCDGSAVQQVGLRPFEICQKTLDEIKVVPEGRVSTSVLQL